MASLSLRQGCRCFLLSSQRGEMRVKNNSNPSSPNPMIPNQIAMEVDMLDVQISGEILRLRSLNRNAEIEVLIEISNRLEQIRALLRKQQSLRAPWDE